MLNLPLYQPKNSLSPTGIFFLILAVLIGGPMYGVLMFLASRLIYLVVIFPIVFGVASGNVVRELAERHGIRNTTLCVVVAVTVGIMTYISFHYAGYIKFQTDIRTILKSEDTRLPEQQINTLTQAFLQRETGITGFPAYMLLSNRDGIRIGHVLATTGGAELSGAVLWGYWLVELGLLAGASGHFARSTLNRPFCEDCQRRYDELHHGGSYAYEHKERVIRALNRRDFDELAVLVEDGEGVPDSLEVYLYRCSGCNGSPDVLQLAHAWVGENGTPKIERLAQVLIERQHADELRAVAL